MDYFWDRTTPILLKEGEQYYEQRDSFSPTEKLYSEQILQLKNAYKNWIMDSIEDDRAYIIAQHKNLSEAFGRKIGILQSIDEKISNIIEIKLETINMISHGKNTNFIFRE